MPIAAQFNNPFSPRSGRRKVRKVLDRMAMRRSNENLNPADLIIDLPSIKPRRIDNPILARLADDADKGFTVQPIDGPIDDPIIARLLEGNQQRLISGSGDVVATTQAFAPTATTGLGSGDVTVTNPPPGNFTIFDRLFFDTSNLSGLKPSRLASPALNAAIRAANPPAPTALDQAIESNRQEGELGVEKGNALLDEATQPIEDVFPLFSQNTYEAPSFTDAQNTFIDLFPEPVAGFAGNPFVGQLRSSIANSLRNPDVIDNATEQALISRATDTILGTARDNEIKLREDLARRGISDSGLASANQRTLTQNTGQDIAQAERDIGIERALARRQSELAAQQTAAALTGQLGRFGLAEQQLATQQTLGEQELAQRLFGQESANAQFGANLNLQTAEGILQGKTIIANILAKKDVFVPSVLNDFQLKFLLDQMEKATRGELDAEKSQLVSNILGGLLQVGASIIGGAGGVPGLGGLFG